MIYIAYLPCHVTLYGEDELESVGYNTWAIIGVFRCLAENSGNGRTRAVNIAIDAIYFNPFVENAMRFNSVQVFVFDVLTFEIIVIK